MLLGRVEDSHLTQGGALAPRPGSKAAPLAPQGSRNLVGIHPLYRLSPKGVAAPAAHEGSASAYWPSTGTRGLAWTHPGSSPGAGFYLPGGRSLLKMQCVIFNFPARLLFAYRR